MGNAQLLATYKWIHINFLVAGQIQKRHRWGMAYWSLKCPAAVPLLYEWTGSGHERATGLTEAKQTKRKELKSDSRQGWLQRVDMEYGLH